MVFLSEINCLFKFITMNISKSLSIRSVSLHNQEVNVEVSIDEVVRNLQQQLNDLHSLVTAIAMSGAQFTSIGYMQEFHDTNKQVRKLRTCIIEMNHLFEDPFDVWRTIAISSSEWWRKRFLKERQTWTQWRAFKIIEEEMDTKTKTIQSHSKGTK